MSYYPRGLIVRKGSSQNSRNEYAEGFECLGQTKLVHLHSFKPILFWQTSISFTFILGGQFLLPQRANCEKREFSQFPK